MDKFEREGERSVSYAEIAKKAWEAGRAKLATMVSCRTRVVGVELIRCSCWIMSCVRRSKSRYCYR